MTATSTRQIEVLRAAMGRIGTYLARSTYMQHQGDPTICDFAFGNPHDMALPGYVDILRRQIEPRDKDWFAYKFSEPYAQEAVAESLRARTGMPFEADDIMMTTGGAGALFVAITAVVEQGDEVIFNLPPWFFYEFVTVRNGGVPVKVPVDRETFDLDVDAIAAAITPRTRVVIVNTPCNPTGRIYPAATLERLARVLEEGSRRNGRTIYLLSDEAYNRIVFDGIHFRSPLEFYPNAMLAYSYGKTLLAPGQRVGYLALPPTMPNREQLRDDLFVAGMANAYIWPNALLQRSVPEFERQGLAIDIAQMQHKRDWMVGALRELGYEVHVPEGTFYLFPKAPIADDWAFVELLERERIFCHPGEISEWPGHFRISLTANEDMIERSLPGFARTMAAAGRLTGTATAGAARR